MNNELNELRKRYADALCGLTYDNASKAEVRVAIEQKWQFDSLSPEQHVMAIEGVKLTCKRCGGTGRFVTGMVNGKLTGPGGSCWRCAGRGYQTHRDGHRNRTFDMHRDH
jgi:hypothetical protein